MRQNLIFGRAEKAMFKQIEEAGVQLAELIRNSGGGFGIETSELLNRTRTAYTSC